MDAFRTAAALPDKDANLRGFVTDVLWHTEAAAYSIRLIMRVFPMLSESDVLRIFPIRGVCAVMSPKHLYIVKVGAEAQVAMGSKYLKVTPIIEHCYSD
jgi:hypothetical protein